MEKKEFNFYVVESGISEDGFADRMNGVVYATVDMLKLAMVKFLDDDSEKAVLDYVHAEGCDPLWCGASDVAEYIFSVIDKIGEAESGEVRLADTPWHKDYWIRRLEPGQVPGYVPFTYYDAVAVLGPGEENDAGFKTQRIVLSKKANEIECSEDEDAVEFCFDRLTPCDSLI